MTRRRSRRGADHRFLWSARLRSNRLLTGHASQRIVESR